MSFQECTADIDGSAVDTDDSGRPSFSSIAKDTGFLDKELSASGFTKKDQEEIAKFIEGGIQKDASTDDEDTEEDEHISMLNEANTMAIDSLRVVDQPVQYDEEVELEGNLRTCEQGPSREPEHEEGCNEERDNETVNCEDDDDELGKRLNKVRRHAVTAARGGRKSFVSRNTYKDKGGKSSNSSKVQRQLSSC